MLNSNINNKFCLEHQINDQIPSVNGQEALQ